MAKLSQKRIAAMVLEALRACILSGEYTKDRRGKVIRWTSNKLAHSLPAHSLPAHSLPFKLVERAMEPALSACISEGIAWCIPLSRGRVRYVFKQPAPPKPAKPSTISTEQLLLNVEASRARRADGLRRIEMFDEDRVLAMFDKTPIVYSDRGMVWIPIVEEPKCREWTRLNRVERRALLRLVTSQRLIAVKSGCCPHFGTFYVRPINRDVIRSIPPKDWTDEKQRVQAILNQPEQWDEKMRVLKTLQRNMASGEIHRIEDHIVWE